MSSSKKFFVFFTSINHLIANTSLAFNTSVSDKRLVVISENNDIHSYFLTAEELKEYAKNNPDSEFYNPDLTKLSENDIIRLCEETKKNDLALEQLSLTDLNSEALQNLLSSVSLQDIQDNKIMSDITNLLITPKMIALSDISNLKLNTIDNENFKNKIKGLTNHDLIQNNQPMSDITHFKTNPEVAGNSAQPMSDITHFKTNPEAGNVAQPMSDITHFKTNPEVAGNGAQPMSDITNLRVRDLTPERQAHLFSGLKLKDLQSNINISNISAKNAYSQIVNLNIKSPLLNQLKGKTKESSSNLKLSDLKKSARSSLLNQEIPEKLYDSIKVSDIHNKDLNQLILKTVKTNSKAMSDISNLSISDLSDLGKIKIRISDISENVQDKISSKITLNDLNHTTGYPIKNLNINKYLTPIPTSFVLDYSPTQSCNRKQLTPSLNQLKLSLEEGIDHNLQASIDYNCNIQKDNFVSKSDNLPNCQDVPKGDDYKDQEKFNNDNNQKFKNSNAIKN